MSIIAAKAARLLIEGRVHVVQAGHGHPGRAIVTGDHAAYEVVVDGGRVVCPCPARVTRCSHAAAVALVVEAQA